MSPLWARVGWPGVAPEEGATHGVADQLANVLEFPVGAVGRKDLMKVAGSGPADSVHRGRFEAGKDCAAGNLWYWHDSTSGLFRTLEFF
jgi:hypothetical protein